MERTEEKCVEVERQYKKPAEGLMVGKLKEGVLLGQKGGHCICSTPPPIWRLQLPSQNHNHNHLREFLNFLPTSTVSARKLCASLWEIQPHKLTPLGKMNRTGTRLRRRLRPRRHLEHHRAETSFEVHKQLAEIPDTPPSEHVYSQPASGTRLRRHVAASLVQHNRSVERNGCALQPVSPASYSSSMEVASHNHEVSPTTSADFKGMIGESSHSPGTPRALLKILNRIWNLEEQHASTLSVVKALKTELDHSQTKMEELLREKRMNKQEMENLMKKMIVEKFIRKNKEHDRIQAAVQSINQELENERRLRKHSESLHRKLARELNEVKSSFSGSLRNLERERKARILLENLCDEFAKGIRDYEQEVHSLRCSSEKSQVNDTSIDRLILHISEAWLDERLQMKLSESGNDLTERSSIVDKLGFDIETFLHAKRSVDLKRCGYSYSSPKEIQPCQQSFDSFPLKEAPSSASQNNMAQEDSFDTNFFEPENEGLNKTVEEITEGNDESCCILDRKTSEMGDENTAILNEGATQSHQECEKPDPESVTCRNSKLCISEFDKSESCTKLPKGVKENTLMAKLLEARLEGKKSRSRSSKRTS